jgi:hypothetical protein
MMNIFYQTGTVKVACFKTHERGAEQYAYFDDIEKAEGEKDK